jgi:hypothetical protein
MLHCNYSSTSVRATSEGGVGNGTIIGDGGGRGGGAGAANGATPPTDGATPATNGATKRALEFECGHVVQWDDGEVCA